MFRIYMSFHCSSMAAKMKKKKSWIRGVGEIKWEAENRNEKFDALHTSRQLGCHRFGWNGVQVNTYDDHSWLWWRRSLYALTPISCISCYEQFNVPTSFTSRFRRRGVRFQTSKLCYIVKHITEFIRRVWLPFCNLNDVWQKQRLKFLKACLKHI